MIIIKTGNLVSGCGRKFIGKVSMCHFRQGMSFNCGGFRVDNKVFDGYRACDFGWRHSEECRLGWDCKNALNNRGLLRFESWFLSIDNKIVRA